MLGSVWQTHVAHLSPVANHDCACALLSRHHTADPCVAIATAFEKPFSRHEKPKTNVLWLVYVDSGLQCHAKRATADDLRPHAFLPRGVQLTVCRCAGYDGRLCMWAAQGKQGLKSAAMLFSAQLADGHDALSLLLDPGGSFILAGCRDGTIGVRAPKCLRVLLVSHAVVKTSADRPVVRDGLAPWADDPKPGLDSPHK